jgi:hypothetical protein
MNEDWNTALNQRIISPVEGMLFAAIAQQNVAAKTLVTVLVVLRCFLINMFHIIVIETNRRAKQYKNAGGNFQVPSFDMARKEKVDMVSTYHSDRTQTMQERKDEVMVCAW